MATLIRRTPFRFSDASEDNSHVHVPLLSAPSSTFEPSAALDALRRKALQPFDDSDPRHLLALETLWHCAFPGGLHPQPFERTSKQWSQLGFQGLDPCTDLRGGSHDGRVRLAPQSEWPVNEPEELEMVLSQLEAIQQDFNGQGGAQISMADMIVLAGVAAVESAAKAAGHPVEVPFTPGRADATADETDASSFDVLSISM